MKVEATPGDGREEPGRRPFGRVSALSGGPVSRRKALARLAALACLGAAAMPGAAHAAAGAQAVVPHRIVVMNWELGEMLLSLGVVPIGMSLPDWYRRTIVEPPLPAGVADIGLLYQPNFEMLQSLHPDLMVITTGHAPARRWLERIAPTLTLGMYRRAPDPYRALCAETALLAGRLARPERACALIAETGAAIDAMRSALAAQPARTVRPVIVAELADDRRLRVYGRGSLFDEMLTRIGVANAAHPRADGEIWPTDGGYALVPLQRLVEVSDASLLIVGPIDASMRASLESNAIWAALPAIREKRVATLPVIAPYGGLVSMQRFVRAVGAALGRIEAGEVGEAGVA